MPRIKTYTRPHIERRIRLYLIAVVDPLFQNLSHTSSIDIGKQIITDVEISTVEIWLCGIVLTASVPEKLQRTYIHPRIRNFCPPP